MGRFLTSIFGADSQEGPTLPDGLRLYVIGDIHGRLDLLTGLFEKITVHNDASQSEDIEIIEIFLGDYIDRGLQSKEVVEWLCSSKPIGNTRIFLKGNHEATLLSFLDDPDILNAWSHFGGLETLSSYGVDLKPLRQMNGLEQIQKSFARQLPAEHLRFFQNLQLSVNFGDYFFVHAGIRPGIPLEEQREEDMLWIREPFLESDANHGKIIVHGHTPVNEPELWSNRINIDTGAFLTNKLTCLVLEKSSKKCL